MAKNISILADKRRAEHADSLDRLTERCLCEMVQAHFESHPALPGEKTLRDQAVQVLAQIDNQTAKAPDGFKSMEEMSPFDDGIMSAEEKNDMVERYAKTRIRETSIKEGSYYMGAYLSESANLKRVADMPGPDGHSTISIDRSNVRLVRHESDEVGVLAERADGGYQFIGTLPDNFLVNNPMAVDACSAELQLVDYSNGKMKNVSALIVVDTDLMSGDVLDLEDDMLAGLTRENGIDDEMGQ